MPNNQDDVVRQAELHRLESERERNEAQRLRALAQEAEIRERLKHPWKFGSLGRLLIQAVVGGAVAAALGTAWFFEVFGVRTETENTVIAQAWERYQLQVRNAKLAERERELSERTAELERVNGEIRKAILAEKTVVGERISEAAGNEKKQLEERLAKLTERLEAAEAREAEIRDDLERAQTSLETLGRRINYSYSATGDSGTTTLRPGGVYEIAFQRGGCGSNDIAQCRMDSDFTLQAFNDDACGPPVYGTRVTTGCSTAIFSDFIVQCCFE